MQVQGALQSAPSYRNTLDAAAKIGKREGLAGFYRGFGVILWGTVPGNIAYFGGYELGKAVVPAGWGTAGDMMVGAIAQIVAGAVYNPVDIIKERMQAQVLMSSVYNYKNSAQAIGSLLRQAGPAGLLKGYWMTNLAWIPWNVIYIASYEASRARMAEELPGVKGVEALPSWAVASCACGSAALGAVLTQPFDVVKTRLQVLAAAPRGSQLTGLQVARQVLRTEGWRGFYAGTGARVMSIAPESAIVWLLYEYFKNIL
mmetsp:Transcript_45005/g.113944  ORF Transcript_45005/g.113944 Transcript_45005/m.113944 type:complete len:258 (+) Transcript_45005:168-941(+)